jgi:ABC-type phosphate transport system substrate-binding protein
MMHIFITADSCIYFITFMQKVFRRLVEKWISHYPLLEATINAIGSSEGWKMV